LKGVILLLTREKAIQLLRERQDYLRDEFGVSRIGFFGSVARDEPNDSSDIDMIVEFSRPIGFRFIDLADYLEGLLGRKVDLLTSAGIQAIRSQHVSENIAEDAVYV
jgi:predicted nucleotidyltransferase